jgi:hypothetical protein
MHYSVFNRHYLFESQAIEYKCGSIAITQETAHIVIHMNYKVDPGIMAEVCREFEK